MSDGRGAKYFYIIKNVKGKYHANDDELQIFATKIVETEFQEKKDCGMGVILYNLTTADHRWW
jgi:hypothetical protein